MQCLKGDGESYVDEGLQLNAAAGISVLAQKYFLYLRSNLFPLASLFYFFECFILVFQGVACTAMLKLVMGSLFLTLLVVCILYNGSIECFKILCSVEGLLPLQEAGAETVVISSLCSVNDGDCSF